MKCNVLVKSMLLAAGMGLSGCPPDESDPPGSTSCEDDGTCTADSGTVVDTDGSVVAGDGGRDAGSILDSGRPDGTNPVDSGCTPGTLGCACNSGACQDGLVCDSTLQTCRAPKNCAQSGCAAHQLCEAADGKADATCLPECENGYRYIANTQSCEPIPTCTAGAPGSILEACTAAHEHCVVQTDGVAICQGCLPGYTQGTSNQCRPVLTCTDLDCGLEHRKCVPEGTNTDARCGDCVDGFAPDNFANCVPFATCLPNPANVSILEKCTQEHRDCIDVYPEDGLAECGACIANYSDVNGTCEPTVRCADLDCAMIHKECVDTPNGHCEGCLPGYTLDADGETCRLPLTCAAVSCQAPQRCVLPDPSTGQDAYCTSGSDCGTNALLGSDNICHLCPPCTNREAGEDGPYLDALTEENRCICRTLPGYYWQVGNFPHVERCDADGDGWVRESAKQEFESQYQAVRENARCNVHIIDRFILTNVGGQDTSVLLSDAIGQQTLSLYETDATDDQVLLDQANLPPYGPDGRKLKPNELNSLVKYCVNSSVDYNRNGLADVNEWHLNPNTAAVRDTYKPLVNFTYFGELFDGFFTPGEPGMPGAYHIVERSRLATAPDGRRVPVVYPDGRGDYWQKCDRLKDSAYQDYVDENIPLNGMDFQRFANTNNAEGIGHTSQYKCLQIVDSPSPGNPHWMTNDEVAASSYLLNECVVEPEAGTVGPREDVGAANPSAPIITCTSIASGTQLPNGSVRLAAVDFMDYAYSGGYQRGCVNECMEYPYHCPGFTPTDNHSACEGMPDNFGKLGCGCNLHYGGVDCDVPCPGGNGVDDLLVGPGYRVINRVGYWMCGHASMIDTRPLVEASPPPAGGYRLQGDMPVGSNAIGVLTGGGYTLR